MITTTLRKLSEYTARGISPKYVETNGLMVLNQKCIRNQKIDFSPARLTDANKKFAPSKKIKLHDILINSTGVGTLGRVAQVSKELNATVDSHITIFRSLDYSKELDIKICKKYIGYALREKEKEIEALGKGATGQTELSKDSVLDNIEIRIPKEFEKQNEIASVLAVYDDLMENNEKRIKILEEMAQLIYTEWFVKFKFPGYEKVKLVDSGTEFGMIPERWGVKKLEAVIDFVRGRSYSSDQISDTKGEYYIANLKSFNRGGGFRFDGEKYYSGPVKENQLLKQGDIIVAVTDMTNDRAVIARPARIPSIKSSNITLSADVVKIIPKKLPKTFVYYSLLDYRFTETTKNKASGANVLHLKPTAILEHNIVLPSESLLTEFDNICSGMIELLDNLLERNQQLVQMRDLLIPQLVTGKRELKEIKNNQSRKDAFKDAIIFSYYINSVSTSNFCPTHLRAVKNIYFVDRFSGVDPLKKYAEQAFGPYSPQSTYAGGESIALRKKYIKRVKGGFGPGEKIADINNYTYSDIGMVDKVVSALKYKKDKELELLATVDYIVYKKIINKEKPNAKLILDYIKKSKVWSSKINRLDISIDKIEDALQTLRNLSKVGLVYPKI